MKSQISLAKYIEHIQTNGYYWFTKKQFITDTKSSITSFKQSAYRLSRDGKIFRFAKGFYVIIPIEYRNTGIFPPIHFVDHFMAYIKQDYYVGLLSAASYYGFTHQQPQQFQVITSKILHLGENNPINIKFFQKKYIELTPIQKIKINTGYVNYSILEATALDLVQYWQLCGGWSNVATVLAEMHPALNSTILAKIAREAKYSVVTIQRLGYLMEILQANNICKMLDDYLQNIKVKTRCLSPECTNKGSINIRWNLIINDQFEIDEI